jgi:acetyl-CoA carboxylase biotin carboxyl carrier protein
MATEESDLMDIRLIQKLVRLMSKSDVTELEIDDSNTGVKLRLKRGADQEQAALSPVVNLMGPMGGAPALAQMNLQPMGMGGAGGVGAGMTGSAESDGPSIAEGAHQVLSPMLGTFYRSPSPDSEPYIDVGSRIAKEDMICIIEAMKVMNEIRSEVVGEVLEVLVENGEPVEYGQPLFLVKTA